MVGLNTTRLKNSEQPKAIFVDFTSKKKSMSQ